MYVEASAGSGGGGVKSSSGEQGLSSSANTPIPCGFEPKTITYSTVSGTYWQKIYYDKDLTTYNGNDYQSIMYGSNNSATQALIGDTTGARIISIDPVGSANNPTGGFTVGKGSGTYGMTCKYKAYG